MWHPIKHFKTIQAHRKEVRRLCIKVGIPWQGIFHDLSKFSPTEFIPGAHYYVGTKSPNVVERQKNGYSLAWMHHQGRNKHHFEYWMDYDLKGRGKLPVKMPLRYLKEMFCDRIAASKVYQGENYVSEASLNYFRKGGAKKMMHPTTAKWLEYWLEILAQEGEEAALSYVRKMRESMYE